MEFVTIPNPSGPLAPQLVALVNPATGLPAIPLENITDSTGAPINPDSWGHAYAYSASGLIVTDTGTDGTTTWVKTYSYNATAQLTGETKWVRQ